MYPPEPAPKPGIGDLKSKLQSNPALIGHNIFFLNSVNQHYLFSRPLTGLTKNALEIYLRESKKI